MPRRSSSPESGKTLSTFSWDDLHRVRYWGSGLKDGMNALGTGARFVGGERHDDQLTQVPTRWALNIYPHNFETKAQYEREVQRRGVLNKLAETGMHGFDYDTKRAEAMTDELADYLRDELDVDESELVPLEAMRGIIRTRETKTLEAQTDMTNRLIGKAGIRLWVVAAPRRADPFRGTGVAAPLQGVTVIGKGKSQEMVPVVLDKNENKKGLLSEEFKLISGPYYENRKD